MKYSCNALFVSILYVLLLYINFVEIYVTLCGDLRDFT